MCGQESAEDVLADTIRLLCVARDERKKRMKSLIESVGDSTDRMPLSAEEILTLIGQHLACRNTSRLPVLLIAAVYTAAKNKIGETISELFHHNAADRQTGALGDVQVCLVNDARVVTCYEVKQKRVSVEDIDLAVTKIASHTPKIDNYIFVTTETIDELVAEHARLTYRHLEGVEVAVMDCLGFVRHFLHLFHRIRGEFLDAYQKLILAEPDSAVSQPLKEAFLSLRQAAESDE